MVLSGSAAYKPRTRKAAQLYRDGVAPLVFITDDGGRGGWSQSEKRNLPFVELAQRELMAGGVLPDAIKILPGQVSGTDSEAQALAIEMESMPLRSVVLVTSPYHSRRALWTFDTILSGKGVRIGMEHSPIDELTSKSANWWLHPRGWREVGGEYVKSIAYWMFY